MSDRSQATPTPMSTLGPTPDPDNNEGDVTKSVKWQMKKMIIKNVTHPPCRAAADPGGEIVQPAFIVWKHPSEKMLNFINK